MRCGKVPLETQQQQQKKILFPISNRVLVYFIIFYFLFPAPNNLYQSGAMAIRIAKLHSNRCVTNHRNLISFFNAHDFDSNVRNVRLFKWAFKGFPIWRKKTNWLIIIVSLLYKKQCIAIKPTNGNWLIDPYFCSREYGKKKKTRNTTVFNEIGRIVF